MSEILSSFLARDTLPSSATGGSVKPLAKAKPSARSTAAVAKATSTLLATARAVVAAHPSSVAKDAAPAAPSATTPRSGPRYVERAPATPPAAPGSVGALFQSAVREVPEPDGTQFARPRLRRRAREACGRPLRHASRPRQPVMSRAADPGVLHPSARNALNAKARLNELTALVNDAVATYAVARDRAADPHADAERVSHDLIAYHAAVQFRQRQPDADEGYRLSVELLKSIEDEGLILVPVDPRRSSAGFKLVNPTLEPAVAATEVRARAAAQERDAFARANAALLNEHDERQKLKRVRDALDGDDPTAFRDALAGVGAATRDMSTNSLTTDDLAVLR
jgi:hypothetical protein